MVKDSFTYPPSLGRNRKDQLYYLKGEKEPYTGPYEILDNHGQLLFKGHFKDGKNHGVYEEFENGEVCYRETFSDGVLNGLNEVFDEQGKLERRGYYLNGKKDGYWEDHVLPEDDGVVWKTNYKNGQRHGQDECFVDGKCIRSSNFNYGYEHGLELSSYENGQLEFVRCFTNGKRSGVWYFFDEEGNLVKKKFYDEKGNLESIEAYKDGKRLYLKKIGRLFDPPPFC